MDSWIALLFFTLFFIVMQGVFALFEMASLSCSRIRLQYYASLGKKSAIWLNALLARPSRFFGTTLIGINVALLVGSEYSRRFYESIHLDPDIAPLTQVFLVVVFGELCPMFTARRHPTQIALSLAPLMMMVSKILMPLIWMFDLLSRLVHKFIGKSKKNLLFFSREEVAIAFRERDGEDELNALTERVFQLKTSTVGQIMTPISQGISAPYTLTLQEARHLLNGEYTPVILLYRQEKQNIVAVVSVRDLLRLKEDQKIIEKAKSPWFVTKETSVLEILNQFRKNSQSAAVIIDEMGQACGILMLDKIVSQIFGKEESLLLEDEPILHVERTLPGEMLVEEFNREFQADLEASPEETLSDLLNRVCNHTPLIAESVKIDSYIFTVKELTLREVKTLSVRSANE